MAIASAVNTVADERDTFSALLGGVQGRGIEHAVQRLAREKAAARAKAATRAAERTEVSAPSVVLRGFFCPIIASEILSN